MSPKIIPLYDLYGEPPRPRKAEFLHLEILEERSRPSGWTIRPHRHGDLHQVFLISRGGGRISLDGEVADLPAPFVVLAPAGSVHSFTWPAGSDGYVLTVSDTLLRAVLAGHPELSHLFSESFWLQLEAGEARASALAQGLSLFMMESVGADPYRHAAVQGRLLLVLVELARLRAEQARQGGTRIGAEGRLAARFRDLVELRFRSEDNIADLARTLAVSEKQLRLACQKATGLSPLQHVRGRRLLEARRLLIYSAMTIAEIGYSLGFDDPAYFSRFFSTQVGIAPADYRARNRRLEEV